MLTVLDSINKSAEYLAKKGIESARTNAELLLAHLLQCKRLDLYLKFDRPLNEVEIIAYREFIRRRGLYEPVQYIIGSVEFYGLKINVSPSVLIPRPETELLVETIISNTDKNSKINILDVGSGSGNITIALAVNLPGAFVTGIDISEEAIKVAAENANCNNISGQVNFIKKDILNDGFPGSTKFDMVVSNPPYVSNEDYKNVQPEIKNFEPGIAVTDFGDGLSYFRKIAEISDEILNKKGKLFFEIGIHQSENVKTILQNSNFKNISVIKDYQDIDRIIYGEKS